MLQVVRRTGGRAAVATGAAAAALSCEGAECRASQPLEVPLANEIKVPSADEISSASALMKDTVVTMSQDGTAWLDIAPGSFDFDLDEFLDLAANVAAEPSVQRVIVEKAEAQRSKAEAQRLPFVQPTEGSLRDSRLTESVELVPEPKSPPHSEGSDSVWYHSLVENPSLVASSIESSDGAEELKSQVESLRSENATLKAALQTTSLKAALLADRPREAVVAPVVDPVVEPKAAPSVVATLMQLADGKVKVDLALAGAPAKERGEQARPSCTGPQQALLVAVAVVVGVLAVVIARNPKTAKMAAQSAVATVATLFTRAAARR